MWNVKRRPSNVPNFIILRTKVILNLRMLSDKNHLNYQDNVMNGRPPFFSVVVFFGVIILCYMLLLMVMSGYEAMAGMDYAETLDSLDESSDQATRNFIRTNALLYQLFAFLIPGVIFSVFLYKSNWARFLCIDKIPNLLNVAVGIVLIFAAFPLVQFFYWINLQIPLPEGLINLEDQTADLVKNILFVEKPYELWLNLLVIALIPALGEEFIFRGILQKKLIQKLENPHVGIWIVAIIFSAVHMQFQGFLSRMFLGGVLGYMYYWTGNLWVPIVADFFNNAFQIIGQYMFQKEIIELNLEDTPVEPNWLLTIGSIVVIGVLSTLLIRKNPQKSIAGGSQEFDSGSLG